MEKIGYKGLIDIQRLIENKGNVYHLWRMRKIYFQKYKYINYYIIIQWEKDEKVTPLAKFKGNLTAWHHPDP